MAIELEDEPIFVEGPLHAVEVLEGVRPNKSGGHYLAALRACDLACCLQGRLGSSREFFFAAALAAHVLKPQQILGPVEDAALARTAPFAKDTGRSALPQGGNSDALQTKAALSNSTCSL